MSNNGITKSEVLVNYHGPVDYGHGNSADYVASSAVYNLSEGTDPTESYKNVDEPYEALELALNDLESREKMPEFGKFRLPSLIGRVAMVTVYLEKDIDFAMKYAESFIKKDGVAGVVLIKDIITDQKQQIPFFSSVETDYGTYEEVIGPFDPKTDNVSFKTIEKFEESVI